MSDEIVSHHVTSVTILEVLASIGGLHRIIKLVGKWIGDKFNSKVLNSKFIRNMYYIKDKNFHETGEDDGG